jgi:Spy/CpxP family protein refolding chaperone
MSLLRCLGLAAMLVFGLARAEAPVGTVPREDWQRMTHEQRQQIWRGMSREQRADVIRNLTPEQREALRARMERRLGDGGPGSSGEGSGPRRLTPEQRQRLREQINQANRDWRERPRLPPAESGDPVKENK